MLGLIDRFFFAVCIDGSVPTIETKEKLMSTVELHVARTPPKFTSDLWINHFPPGVLKRSRTLEIFLTNGRILGAWVSVSRVPFAHEEQHTCGGRGIRQRSVGATRFKRRDQTKIAREIGGGEEKEESRQTRRGGGSPRATATCDIRRFMCTSRPPRLCGASSSYFAEAPTLKTISRQTPL